jgi:hypothetical protein
MAAAAAADCSLFFLFCIVLIVTMRVLNRTRAGMFMSYT